MKKILTIEDTFMIEGRGPTILAKKTNEFVDFKIGDLIKIENSYQTFIETKVKGIDFFCRPKFRTELISFLIESGITKEQVQIGANIWLVED